MLLWEYVHNHLLYFPDSTEFYVSKDLNKNEVKEEGTVLHKIMHNYLYPNSLLEGYITAVEFSGN